MKPDIELLYIGFLLGHGGDALQMLELAAGMAARGRRVGIVVPALDSTIALAERCRARGIPIERSPLLHADAFAARQNIVSLIRLFQGARGAALHLHTGDVCLPRSVLLALDALRCPRAFATIHSPYDTMQAGEPRARTWSRAVERRFHTVVCPSAHGRKAQIRYGVPPDRVRTIFNCVDVERFAAGNADAARAALGIESTAKAIVFSSRLEIQKRPQDALDAFRQVALEFPDTHLVFAGRGSQEAALRGNAERSGIGGRVHFVGYRDDIPDWLALAAVWILPTEAENFSLAVLEALAAGCAILSTDCTGNDEVLVDKENALTTAVGDVGAMAGALRRLLTEEDLRRGLGRSARRTAQAYTAARMVDQYEACYAEALRWQRPAAASGGEPLAASAPTREMRR